MADCRCDSLIVQTALVPLGLGFTSRGLCRLDFHGRIEKGPAAKGDLARQVARALQAYAAGKKVQFTVPVDLSSGTSFQQSVWRALAKIPRGETRSYAWVAKQIGRP